MTVHISAVLEDGDTMTVTLPTGKIVTVYADGRIEHPHAPPLGSARLLGGAKLERDEDTSTDPWAGALQPPETSHYLADPPKGPWDW